MSLEIFTITLPINVTLRSCIPGVVATCNNSVINTAKHRTSMFSTKANRFTDMLRWTVHEYGF